MIGRCQEVECLGEHCGKIVVGSTDDNPPVSAATLPDLVRLVGFVDYLSVLNCQVDSQSLHGQLVVGRLASFLRGGRLDICGKMLDEDARLDFVAMLPTRTAPSLASNFAASQERFVGEQNWVCRSSHRLVIIRGAMPDQVDRYISDHQLPAYSYVPGLNAHPKRSDGHGCPGPTDTSYCDSLSTDWSRCRLYLWGFDLFNHRYYWEAHEAWEGVWIAVGRTGTTANFLKGLIKLAAAGVKAREGQATGVRRHARRAEELFQNTQAEVQGDHYSGCDLSLLTDLARRVAATPESFINTADAPVACVFTVKLLLE